MSKFTSLPVRALELASQVGDSLKQVAPHAGKWLETGAKLGVLKQGTRVAGTLVRRNPVMAVVSIAGAGLLWFAARHRAKRADNAAIEGTAKRIDARKGDPVRKRRATPTTTAARKRTAAASKKSD